jgi:SAM-dependent methyltransferase
MLAHARGPGPEGCRRDPVRRRRRLRAPLRERNVRRRGRNAGYEYVQDATAALGEAFRVLRPGGRLLVLDTDWGSIVWHSGDAERMRRVLAAWEEHLVDPHPPPRLTRLLSAATTRIRDAASSDGLLPAIPPRCSRAVVRRPHGDKASHANG